MIDLDHELADFKSFEDFADDREYLRIGDHESIVSSNIEIALIELSESTLIHLRLITSINFGNMEALNLLNALGSNVTSERHGEIVPECKQLSTLVLQIIDKLAILTILASQSLFQFKNWRVNLTCTVLVEYPLNFVEGVFTDGHL